MKLVAGLGNPGAAYARTRHNAGFMALEHFHATLNAQPWRQQAQALLATAHCDGFKVLLLKPQTYMNLSGQSLGAVARFYKIALDDVIVVHDEIDLLPGKLRIKQGGGHAGHNGLKSIDATLGRDYWRVRIGIGRPLPERESVQEYVLQNFSAADTLWLTPLLAAMANNLPRLLAGQPADFINKIAQEIGPCRSGDDDTHNSKKPIT